MASTMSIFSAANSFIDGKLDGFLNTSATSVIAELAAPMRAALSLYVLLYGIAILRGAISEPITDFAVRSLKLAFIYKLSTTVAYSSWVTTPLFHTLPETLTRAISGAASPDAGAAFDQFFAHAAYLGEKIAQGAGAWNYQAMLLSAAVIFVGALAAALGFGVTLIAKIALALLVALGPIFIGCALFDASRRFFLGWLSQAVNYLVLMALIVTVFQLVLSLVAQEWGQIDGADPIAGGVVFIALCVLAAIFFLQVPSIAAGVAGGASAGMADFAGAAGAAWRGGERLIGTPGQAPRGGTALNPAPARN